MECPMFMIHPTRPIAYNAPILHTPARYVYPSVPTRHLTPACTRTHHITIHTTHAPHSNCTPSLTMCTHPTRLAISHLHAPSHNTSQSLDTTRHSTCPTGWCAVPPRADMYTRSLSLAVQSVSNDTGRTSGPTRAEKQVKQRPVPITSVAVGVSIPVSLRPPSVHLSVHQSIYLTT